MKTKRLAGMALVAALALTSVFAFGSVNAQAKKAKKTKLKAQTISFHNREVDTWGTWLTEGKTLNLKAKAKTALTYSSTDKSVATVSKSGVVKGLKEGSATIVVKAKKTKKYKAATARIDFLIESKGSSNSDDSNSSNDSKSKTHEAKYNAVVTGNSGTKYSYKDNPTIPLSDLKNATFMIENLPAGKYYLSVWSDEVAFYLDDMLQDWAPNHTYAENLKFFSKDEIKSAKENGDTYIYIEVQKSIQNGEAMSKPIVEYNFRIDPTK